MGKSWDRLDGTVLHDPSVVGGFQDGAGGNPFSRSRIRYGRSRRWEDGGGFSAPGIGERDIEWPSFSATAKHGTANPTCAVCGGRLRGAKKCECPKPHDPWKPTGKRRDPENEEIPDHLTGGGMTSHMNAIQEWHLGWLTECYRVLVPGGVLKAFSATRTFHRMAAAMQEAGFTDIRLEAWAYGSGFPKSLSISKAIDKAAGRIGHAVEDLKEILREAHRKSGKTLGELNEVCGFEASGYLRGSSTWAFVLPPQDKWVTIRSALDLPESLDACFAEAEREVLGHKAWSNSKAHFTPGEDHTRRVRLDVTAPATREAHIWDGWGTALKPSWEPVLVGRKPL
jgi:hypothetical protein